ncbi:DgyrCDS1896 [Dimorphilus gyrociliatus]|uniref:DgyrCDS1896 n=1 Tax=Dimorphilus gyrociliatus TaxID=2664684 RepID=A0A7I8VBS8_9ANNE|nr:DgyrCDS1896 [Dimorphilus gyrociliatus]
MLDLDSLRYNDLQTLAKQFGIKANQKAVKLKAVLKKKLESIEDEDKNELLNKTFDITDDEDMDTSTATEEKVDIHPDVSIDKSKDMDRENDIKDLQEESKIVNSEPGPSSATPLKESSITKKRPPCDQDKVAKSAKKIKARPDFASIHRKNFDKMQSIDDVVKRREEQRKRLALGKSVEKKIFKPSVTSLKEATFDFGKTTPANSTNSTKIFKFTATPSTGSQSSRKKFNLTESLKKPLSYKPHCGKLKPFDGKNVYTTALAKRKL